MKTALRIGRLRELSQVGVAPSLRVYAPPARPAASGAAVAVAPAPAVSYPTYRPYVGEGGQPYTDQQHDASFFGPVQPRSPGQVMTATERGTLVKPAARAAPP